MGPTVFKTAQMRRYELGGGLMLTEVSLLGVSYKFGKFQFLKSGEFLKISKYEGWQHCSNVSACLLNISKLKYFII